MLKRTGTFIVMLTLPTLANPFINASRANILPPPVKQNIGFFDAVFNDLVIDQCTVCHGADSLSCHHSSDYSCVDCHDYTSGSMAPDCFSCHKQETGEQSVHHMTETAQQGECASCHQNLVENLNDEHNIPDYSATMVTPRPSYGLGTDGRGSCRFCHDGGTDEVTGELILCSSETHHGTGLDECFWCHDSSFDESLAIRTCEQCHTPLSIHNIQADANNDGVITPGGEQAGYGHIGNNDDCLGCHGGFVESARTTGRKGTIDKPTRHHLLVPAKNKKCLDCHKLVLNQEGFFVFEDFRTCSSCHGNHRN